MSRSQARRLPDPQALHNSPFLALAASSSGLFQWEEPRPISTSHLIFGVFCILNSGPQWGCSGFGPSSIPAVPFAVFLTPLFFFFALAPKASFHIPCEHNVL